MALRTTVVGSWWTRTEDEAALHRYHRGQLTAEQGEELLKRCAGQAIKEQMELGLREWTGGEYFTDVFINHLQKVLTGVELDRPSADPIFDYDDLGHARIVGQIDAPEGLGYAAAYRRESQLPGGVTKATVVGPFEISIHAQDQRDELLRQLPNLIRIVNREMRELAAAGCTHIQLDVPTLGCYVNMGLMSVDQAADIIAPCFEDINGGIRAIHMCNGNNRGRPRSGVLRNASWVPILQRLEGVVDLANLECSYFSEYLERDAFKDLPQSMELAAGIVDEANYWPEPVAKIRARAEDWARVVGEERLWISPSCGFGRHPARDRDVLRTKMEHMVEAAATL